MKQLRAIRILLAALFLLATADCLIIGFLIRRMHPMARAAEEMQIIFSASAIGWGVLAVWLLLTFLFGRIYCASFCPVGVLSDVFFRIRKHVPKLNRPFSYRRPSKLSIPILLAYIICIAAGVVIVPFLIEPWNIARNIASVAEPSAVDKTLINLDLGVGTGIVAGIVSGLLIAVTSLWRGREFCSRYCPLGTALGIVQQHSVMHIELDPDKCTSCGICEDNCRSQCINIADRIIDQKRCVRCFDCVADCPEGAIRYQINRNMRPASPLMRKANTKT